jgi:hypothetical protein
MRRPIFTQEDLGAIHEARAKRAAASGPCAKCQQTIAPGTLYGHDAEGRPVHFGACPTPGRFTAARIEFEGRE